MIGSDYNYFLPYLLSGVQWIYQNGWLTIPYFTPDYCGGIPWLALPRSAFYSVPQLLATLTNPVTAIKWTAITFATIGGAASYGLLRKCFGASWQAATLAFVLFQLNTFLLFRIAVGHLTYDIFGLTPVLALLVLLPTAAENELIQIYIRTAGKIIAAAILLAMMVYAGAPDLIIPAVLSVVTVLLIHQARMGWQSAPWCILVGACLWAIPLSALKIVPTVILTRNYPRAYLVGQLFADPIRLFKVLAASLFAPEILPPDVHPIRGSLNWLGLHEFEFGVSVVPLLLIFAAILLFAMKPSRPQHLIAWIALALVVAFPIALTSGNEAWGRILLKIPIISDYSTLIRLWSSYITPLIVVAGLSFDRVPWDTRVRDVAFGASVLVVIAQLMSRNLGYYESTNPFQELYDPAPVIQAVEGISTGMPLPEISQVGPPVKSGATDRRENNGLIHGISAYPCRESLFGYSHELFPARQLRVGPVKSEVDGHFNLIDPRCYLSLDSKRCSAGELFREDEESDVAVFTSHRPLPWELPFWQTFAEAATIVAGMLSALGLLTLVVASAVRRGSV